jgi:hypothetical protein
VNGPESVVATGVLFGIRTFFLRYIRDVQQVWKTIVQKNREGWLDQIPTSPYARIFQYFFTFPVSLEGMDSDVALQCPGPTHIPNLRS